MKRDRWYTDRRGLLSSLGAGAALGLAGCVGDDEDDDDDTGELDEDDTEETDEGDTEETDEDDEQDADDTDDEEAEQLDSPTEFPDDAECAVCNMVAAEHPEWNAQLVHETGTRTYFCSSGCMTAYHAEPLTFGECEAPIANAWVTGFESGELVDAADAWFVRVTDADHVDDIMMMNPTPFADRTDAEAFVDDFEEYDEDDIITLDAFDRELAMMYRARFFDDDGDNGDDGHNNH